MSVPDGVDLSTGNDGLGVIAFRGADTARYLQGQLSADIETLAKDLAAAAHSGDHILIMSNGGFGGLHERLLAALRARPA